MPPNTPEQKRVAIGLQVADRDMEAATLLVQHSPHLYETVGFHCQQAVEKYLKAALLAFALPSPFIYNLVVLMSSLQQGGKLSFTQAEITQATVLNEFAVELRYELDDAPAYISADLLAMAHGFRHKLRPLALAFLI